MLSKDFMPYRELAAEFGCDIKLARKIINMGHLNIVIQEFSNEERAKAFLSQNPNCFIRYYQVQGPCTNYGWEVCRKETDEERQRRIKNALSELSKIYG